MAKRKTAAVVVVIVAAVVAVDAVVVAVADRVTTGLFNGCTGGSALTTITTIAWWSEWVRGGGEDVSGGVGVYKVFREGE